MKKKQENLYNVVYNDIISKIRSGQLKVGDKLPTEIELTKIYGVSRITIARALKNLVDINLVYRVKKSGTFVNGKLNRDTPLIIPVVLPFNEDFNDIVKGIQSATLNNNIFTPVYNSKNNINREREYLSDIIAGNPDGLIVYPCSSLENIDMYAKLVTMNKPIVCLDRNIQGLNTPLVTTRNAAGMTKIVEKLVQMGHKKIGFFSVSEQMAVTEEERFKGYASGIIANGLPLKKEYIYDTTDLHRKEINLTPDQQKQLFENHVKKVLKKYIAAEDKPTAICCINDSSLEAIIKTATELGIKIPEELTVTGFDNAPSGFTEKYGIIGACQNFYSIGSAAIALMLKILNGQPYPEKTLVDTIML